MKKAGLGSFFVSMLLRPTRFVATDEEGTLHAQILYSLFASESPLAERLHTYKERWKKGQSDQKVNEALDDLLITASAQKILPWLNFFFAKVPALTRDHGTRARQQ